MKHCLAFLLLLAQVFAETNWVTSGNACTTIWNFSSPPDNSAKIRECAEEYNDCIANSDCAGLAPGGARGACIQECNALQRQCCGSSCTPTPPPTSYQDHYAAIWVAPVTAGWVTIDWYGADLWTTANAEIAGRIIDVSAVQITNGATTTTRFDSVYTWETGAARRAFIGVTPDAMSSTINAQAALGLQPVKFRVYKCATTEPSVCYNILFENTTSLILPYSALTEAEADQNWQTLTAAGWRLTDISGVEQANGKVVYTQIWTQTPGSWIYWTGSAGFFQQKLVDMRNANYYLNHVHVYSVNGQVVYMGLFEPVPAANFQWSFIGGLTSPELSKYWNCMNSQYRPLEIASYWDLESHYGR